MWTDWVSLLNIAPGLLFIIVVWSTIWKGIALWKSARNRQTVWFVVLLIVNTIGILEIIYIAFFQRYKKKYYYYYAKGEKKAGALRKRKYYYYAKKEKTAKTVKKAVKRKRKR